MAAAAANRLPFDGVVVQCAQCNRSGCLNCVESLSKELSAWLNSGNGMGYSIAAQDNLESCMWNDILMLPSTPLSGRTWSYRDESLIVFKKALMLSQDGLFGTGPAKQPEGLPDELRRLAQRIRTFTEGSFPPSPPPALVDKITDALLVTALDVVTAVAAEEQQLSSNAAVRLLAWTLADARAAVVPLDK